MAWKLYEFTSEGERHPDEHAFWGVGLGLGAVPRMSDHREMLLNLPYLVVLQFKNHGQMIQLYVNEDDIPKEVL